MTRWIRKIVARFCLPEKGSQLLEFTIALPLLMVIIVGIFDFGGAFTLKQKLNNAAREGARAGSNLSSVDVLNSTVPKSVQTVRDVVDSYLKTAGVNDCGLDSASATGSLGTWTYSASGSGCPSGLQLTVERAHAVPATVVSSAGSDTINVICTRVAIQYPYQWRFSKVIALVSPGATYAAATHISTDAIVPNMN